MRASTAIAAATTIAILGVTGARSTLQTPAVRTLEERALREYAGVYRSEPDGFLYLQLWKEFTGFDKPSQLVAFDDAGDVRVLYPTERDRFFAGPGAGGRDLDRITHRLSTRSDWQDHLPRLAS